MMHSPLHPGAFLKQTFLDELEISASELSRRLGVSRSTVSRLVDTKSDVSIEMAQRLSTGLHGTPEFWINMQTNYDLWITRDNRFENINRDWVSARKRQINVVVKKMPKPRLKVAAKKAVA